MPMIVVPLGLELLNFGLIFLVESPYDSTTKTLLTVGIIIKFICYFVAAINWGEGTARIRNFLLGISALVNGGLIVFSIITNSFMLLINNVVLLVLLVVWSWLTVFDITWTWGKKE